MNILELDEAQGLTKALIDHWCDQNGWRPERDSWLPPQTNPLDAICMADVAATGSGLVGLIQAISHHHKRPAQSLLRDINPRMRPWPSEAARFAHRGFWIAIDPKDYNAVMGRFEKPWFRHSDNLVVTEDMGIMFWPCDVHAQRVRWPTDDKGNML